MKKKLGCVLLIDDDEPTNYYNSLIIEETGCTDYVEAVQSGQEALEYLTNSEPDSENIHVFPCPDLTFLDINMPVMDGWEFLDKYRQLKKEQRGKVIIMLTAALNAEDNIRADKIPEISGFAIKPLTAELIDKVLIEHFDW